MSENLPPPRGYQSWIEYAIVTMDTRDLANRQVMFDDEDECKPWPGREYVQRDDMTESAQREWKALKTKAGKL